MKQISFIPKARLECGGSLSLGRRHERRTLTSQKPLHLVLKSKKRTLFKHRDFIAKTLKRQAKLAGVRLYKHSVQFDHIHLAIKIPDRQAYKKFIRAVTGLLARKLGQGLWRLRPYTRISEWGRAYKKLLKYIELNELEVWGLVPYQQRKRPRPRIAVNT